MMHKRKEDLVKKRISALLLATTAITLVGCSAGDGGNGGDASIDYWLWDSRQLPAYQQCADDFQKANPGITVKITQLGWDDYWSKLTNSMAAGTAPDVFTDHLSKYPDFLKTGQLLPLDDEDIDLSQYADGLADLWVGEDGNRYGLPKDWDTVALFYNATMVADAGITEDEMQNLTWNPEDGGTYERVIAKLTVDDNGVRGDEAGFDKNSVAVYGLGLPQSGAGFGQTEWSYLTGTTGWTHTNTNPWGDEYNFDDPRFQDTISWWAGLIDKGYMPKLETMAGGAGTMPDSFGAGAAAINVNGSWTIGQYSGYEDVNLGIAPTPVGPSGERASMFNGLADSIWAGTEHKAEAAAWVNYLASSSCQDVVGEAGVVFPAIKSSTAKAEAAFQANGVPNVSAFTIHVADGTTFLAPITENASKIDGIMKPAMDAVLSGTEDSSSLTDANEQVNALFK